MRKFLLTFLLISACGPSSPTFYPPSLEVYVREYKELAADYNLDLYKFGRLLYIGYGNPGEKYNGMCYTRRSEYGFANVVLVQKGLSATTLRATVFHELSHCVYLMDHETQVRPHLMNPSAMPDWYVELKWDSLVDSLFVSIQKHEGKP